MGFRIQNLEYNVEKVIMSQNFKVLETFFSIKPKKNQKYQAVVMI
jgi:hypothetical protein